MKALAERDVIKRIKTPTLIIKAGEDKTVSNKAIDKVFEDLEVADKTLLTYSNCDHGIFNDGEYMPLVAKDISDWMEAHSKL